MFKGSMAAIAAVAVVSFAAPAGAATLMVTASGTFAGTDANNVLGQGAGQVTDVAFMINYTIDVGNAVRFMSAENDTAGTGAAYGTPTLSFMHLTLGVLDVTLYGDQQDSTLQGPDVVQQWIHESTGRSVYIGASYLAPTLVADLTAPPAGNLCLEAICYGFVNFGMNLAGTLTPTSYTVTYDVDGTLPPLPGGIVPEPSAWALMIAGFGMAGAALRRRRSFAAQGRV